MEHVSESLLILSKDVSRADSLEDHRGEAEVAGIVTGRRRIGIIYRMKGEEEVTHINWSQGSTSPSFKYVVMTIFVSSRDSRLVVLVARFS